MRQAYYYFAASLPAITFDGKPLMSLEEFLNDCERLLDPHDLNILKSVIAADTLEIPVSSNHLLNRWVAFDKSFRNELAFLRAQQSKKDPAVYMRGDRPSDSSIGEAINRALKMPNPLAAERFIDSVRWQLLDDLVWGHYFDFDCILAYALKLKILERHQLLRSARGAEVLEEYKKFEVTKEKFF